MKKFVTGFAVFVSLTLLGHASWAATYYIRADGGTAEQCTGIADAPYPGSGTNQACAWSHPFWAINSEGSAWRMNGGDTLIISSGSYTMGYGAPNTGWCDSHSAWDCSLPPLPSGSDLHHPTRLLGRGWDSGCPDPPELWGTQRADYILNLTGTSHAIIACLELTDHSGCVEFHANASVRCERDTYPYGDWASIGIYASDSTNVVLKHLNVHGLASGGILAGRLTDWTVEDVRIAGNGWVGWDGDLPDGSDSNGGTLTFRKLTVEWNGCAESYPSRQWNNCWAQTAGGYGDGFGTGTTGGHWVFEDSVFRYNTSDGLDLLYVRQGGSQIEIKRTQAYGNAGNQIKVNGPAKIENSLMVGNCGYFDAKFFTYHVDNCRAGGGALAFALRRGNAVSLVNSTLAGHGDVLLAVDCDDGSCNGSESIIVQNNIFQGSRDFLDPTDTTGLLWFDRDNFYAAQMDYNVIHDVKLGAYTVGSHDIVQDPRFVNADLEVFDGHLRIDSPAIDSGLPVGSLGGLVPGDDLSGAVRPYGSGVDRGAYEYGGSPCTYSISPENRSFDASGGTGTVDVTAPSGCAWTATSHAVWIMITLGASGSGNGSVDYSVPSNPGAERSGTLTIAGKTFTVLQTGVPDPETISTPAPPCGPTRGSSGTSYTYTTGDASSSKGHSVQYLFNWGDGTDSGWLSAGVVTASKAWASTGSFTVKAKARCALDTFIESNWSDPLTVVISNDGPDLTGLWTVELRQSCRGEGMAQKCSIKGTFTIKNLGNEPASTTYANFYLSDNSTHEPGDTQLKSVSKGKIKAGKSKTIRFSHRFPKGESAAAKYIITVIDPDNLVAERDEANNTVVFGPIP